MNRKKGQMLALAAPTIALAVYLGTVGLGGASLLTGSGESASKPDAKPDSKKVAFVAGPRSHGYGAHEHRAGSMLLAKALREGMPDFETVLFAGGWPEDPSAFEGIDAVIVYTDGSSGHPVMQHLEAIDRLMKQGVGLGCLHFAVEVLKGEPGDYFLDWLGGYFEKHWSVNPHWTAHFEKLPNHPITRGVAPFSINDEWYYHMRFREGMEGVVPILSALPTSDTLVRADGARSGNPHVRAAVANTVPQHVAWARRRPDGGRGFGFTGGHVHWNWGNDNFRKLVLNAIVWLSGAEVPHAGVDSSPVMLEDLEANQDFKPPKSYDREEIQKLLEQWQ